MKSKTKTACSLILVAVALWWLWPDRKAEPEQRLIAHMDAMCAIAQKNVSSPKKGVDELFAYLGENSPKMMKAFGKLLVVIERIPDDREHDERARRAAKRLQEAARGCETHWERFFLAVERDPEARATFERGVERLSRTLEILFGGQREVLPDWADRLPAG